MRTRIVPCGVVLLLVIAGCSSSDPTASDEYAAPEQELSSDPTTTEEYQELEQRLADTEQELSNVTAERDALAVQIAAKDDRYNTVVANQQAVTEIIADPTAYGTEEEVLDLLMEYATEDAVMDDVALGSIGMREAWRETVFWTDSDIETFATWLADDGSLGGSLWVWSGTAFNGEPFELIGVNTDIYDENGLVTYERVDWPYQAAHVEEAIENGSR